MFRTDDIRRTRVDHEFKPRVAQIAPDSVVATTMHNAVKVGDVQAIQPEVVSQGLGNRQRGR